VPSPKPSNHSSILWKIGIGFSVIIMLTWLVELIRLPHLMYDEPDEFNWFRVVFRTLILLSIWAWIHVTCRRLLQRLHQLEDTLRVCAWCRKVGHHNEWLSMEDYFDSKFKTETTHGICPECAASQLQAEQERTLVPAIPPADRQD